jgi:hypothetical protein
MSRVFPDHYGSTGAQHQILKSQAYGRVAEPQTWVIVVGCGAAIAHVDTSAKAEV